MSEFQTPRAGGTYRRDEKGELHLVSPENETPALPEAAPADEAVEKKESKK